MPVIVGVLGTVPKDLEKRLEVLGIGRIIEIIQTKVLFRFARILRRLEETCCYKESGERPPADIVGKNLQGVK